MTGCIEWGEFPSVCTSVNAHGVVEVDIVRMRITIGFRTLEDITRQCAEPARAHYSVFLVVTALRGADVAQNHGRFLHAWLGSSENSCESVPKLSWYIQYYMVYCAFGQFHLV